MDWTAFTRKILIDSSIDKIYPLWATPDGLKSWFLRKADFTNSGNAPIDGHKMVQVGDTYIWGWHNWTEYEAKGQILEANQKDHIVFSFEGSTVSVDLKNQDASTLVTLRQYNIPTDEENKMQVHVGCSNGWTFWLTNLKIFCEHRILVNDTSGITADGMDWVNM